MSGLPRSRVLAIRAAARATVEAPTSTPLERARRRMTRAARAMGNAPADVDGEQLILLSDEWAAAFDHLQRLEAQEPRG